MNVERLKTEFVETIRALNRARADHEYFHQKKLRLSSRLRRQGLDPEGIERTATKISGDPSYTR